MPRCQAITKAGKPCQGGAMSGQRYCGPHMGKGEVRQEAIAAYYAEHPKPEHTTFNCWCRHTAPCPLCGRIVHVAGSLMSVH